MLPFLPVCCRDRTERVLAVRTMRRYGKCCDLRDGFIYVDINTTSYGGGLHRFFLVVCFRTDRGFLAIIQPLLIVFITT
ncbi:hypothetical protein D8R79_23355 [Salmonella enterica subsp. enterica serovar Hadar]|nr:hypothetical protein [Salmonella enterica subsp. enterica serovar Hadar]ECA6402096.1 hypothetical protein [Salmonella enterica subsp. enterica serovar Hadar]ECA8829115.1 hypothetical protein [Salmonella enterica subsp. enterica serovar Hadar]ECE9072082.1 hypothetical protein [Salmonella enterica subsp. enterica serovar Hadar]